MKKKETRKPYDKPTVISEKVGKAGLTGGTCNGMTGGGKKTTPNTACTTKTS